MNRFAKLSVTMLLLAFSAQAVAQSDDNEELKIAALEALISAPPERAMPLAARVLEGDHSDEVKERALFILSQIDHPDAHGMLMSTARNADGELRDEAIRMIGISGNADALASLSTLYTGGDEDVRDAVLEAYLIAGDEEAVYELAANAQTDEEFDAAVEILAAMGASDELRSLRDRFGMSESLIEAYIISHDAESLMEIASDNSNLELQAEAIEALGIVGGDEVDAALVDIYRSAATEDIREAALDGMLIAGHDEGVLELYRSSNDDAEKKELLEYLVIMGSEEVWDLIDAALEEGP
ncbi:MAG: HEAT repeat domain-containing protein [Woeseiaceae bacterium]|nr:HEAT repeat domain-containing protein [Woeseiaceae bacterium]